MTRSTQRISRRPSAGSPWSTLCALLVLAACSSPAPEPTPSPPAAGPGITFTSPRDGQRDVPVGTRILAHFSDPVVGRLTGPCTWTDAGVSGAFCLVGPGGVVAATPVLDGTTVVLAVDGGLFPGASYQLFVGPSMVTGSTNLDGGALVSFRTRGDRAIGGQAPTVIALNDFPLEAWADGGVPLPLLDTASLRLVFSEPLDEASVTPESVSLLKVSGATRTAVPGTTLLKGIHLTFDPDEDLEPSAQYVLQLGAAVRDLEGAALTALEIPLSPRRTRPADGGALYPQQLMLTPAWNGVSAPEASLGAMPINTNVLRSNLLGEGRIGLLDGGITVQLGDASAFGGPIPMVVRKGQKLDLSSLPIRFGGVLESGVQTGVLHLVVLSDAVGFLTRNPFRAPGQLPDERAPVFVDLTMDLGLYSADPAGNVISNQTVLAVRLLGTSVVDDDQLLVEQVASLELSTLGIGQAAVSLALQLRTGGQVVTPTIDEPALSSTYPAAAATDFPADGTLQLTFSAPLDSRHLRDGQELTLLQGATPVPSVVRLDGSTVLMKPATRLIGGAAYTLTAKGLRSLDGKPATGLDTLRFSTAGYVPTGVAPFLTAVSVGAPCALIGADYTSGGKCVGSQPQMPVYQPFTAPSNLELHAQFSQPMNPASMVLGAACGQGSVRVERYLNGLCQPVPGTLLKDDKRLRFVPASRWVEGGQYVFTLVGGGDGSCSGGELCSAGGRPLNTVPLLGVANGGGGPDVVLPFTGAPPTPSNYQPLDSLPYADHNANGVIDPTETFVEGNRVAMEISGVGGIVTKASLNGEDCLPASPGQQSCAALHAELPTLIGSALAQCPIDAQGQFSTAPNPCVEVHVMPNLITNTTLSMNTTALYVAPINDLATGTLLMRVREQGGPAYGYIMREGGTASPIFVIRQAVSLDAPDLKILGGLVGHDLKSKPVDLILKGPVTFRPDGRLDVALHTVADVGITVTISALGFTGTIGIRIPAGEMRVTLAGPLVH